jgi:hypothetical protein
VIWKPITETEGLYEVSSCGHVRRKGCKPLALIITADGYHAVSIFVGKKYAQRKVHRLVAYEFVGSPPFENAEVAHNDGVRTNNSVDNLRWDTRTGNQRDRIAHGTHVKGERSSCAKFSNKDVARLRQMLNANTVTRMQLAKQHGVSYETIRAMHSGETYKDAV